MTIACSGYMKNLQRLQTQIEAETILLKCNERSLMLERLVGDQLGAGSAGSFVWMLHL